MSRTLVAVALAAVTVAVYLPVRGHELLTLDDRLIVVDNPLLEGGFSREGVVRAFTTPYLGNWVPLAYISLQLDRSLHGGGAPGVLLVNGALHALATALFFLALVAMTGAPWPSAFAAAVFGLHPLHVESVAWASERKDVLSGVFWMLAMLAHAHYARAPSLPRYLASLAAVTLGLLSKPMLVTLPFVLLLLDYWPLARLGSREGGPWPEPRRLGRAVLEKLPMLAVAAGVSLVTLWSQTSDAAVFPVDVLTVKLRLLNALVSYAAYLGDAFWPAGLAAFYPHPLADVSRGLAAASALLLCAITALALRFARTRPHLIVGWLWYLGTLVPVIGLVQVGMQARADRYTYLPLMGIALMVAFSGAELAARSRGARTAVAAAGVLAALAMAFATNAQLAHWQDSEAVYTRALAVTERNAFAHAGLGFVLADAGENAQAIAHFEEALRINPAHYQARSGLAVALTVEGRTDEVLPQLVRARRDAPDDPVIVGNLGVVLARAGRHDEARPELERAVALRDAAGMEASARVQRALGDSLAALGELEPALASYEVALGVAPEDPELRGLAALAAQQLGLPRRAAEHYRAALAAAPGFTDAANNLAWLLATCEEPDVRAPAEAVALMERAAPDGSPAGLLDTRAVSYAAAGRFEEAEVTAAAAIAAAERDGDSALAAGIRGRAARFAAGEALRERCAAEPSQGAH